MVCELVRRKRGRKEKYKKRGKKWKRKRKKHETPCSLFALLLLRLDFFWPTAIFLPLSFFWLRTACLGEKKFAPLLPDLVIFLQVTSEKNLGRVKIDFFFLALIYWPRATTSCQKSSPQKFCHRLPLVPSLGGGHTVPACRREEAQTKKKNF